MPVSLCPELELAALALAPVFRASAVAPESLKGITAQARKGVFVVWNGGSEKTIFSSPQANYAFRAWHDRCHVTGQHPFTREGELAVRDMQAAEIYGMLGPVRSAMARKFLTAEILGQFDYHAARGHYPDNQRAFALAYLGNKVTALKAEF